jgi:AcrR family transcriptional regulator
MTASPSPARTDGPRRRLGAEERREVIVRAAGPIFAARGYAGTRLDDIAAAAGVTKPIVYRHFDSKKALYLALLAKHRADLPTFFAAARETDGSPQAAIRAILDGWLDYVQLNQHAWKMLFRDRSGDEEIREVRDEVSLRAREVLAGFVAEASGGTVPAAEVEPTAELLTSGLAGLALWWIDNPTVPKEVVLEVAARACAGAIAGRGA